MNTFSKNERQPQGKESGSAKNKISPDSDADKTGTDTNQDKTEPRYSDEEECDDDQLHINKFDKPKRETDPDRTGIDTESDKTKPNK